LLRSADNPFQLTDPLPLLVNEQLRVANDVDEQNVSNLELEIRLRMSGHIPLGPSDYMPYTPIYQQNFGFRRLEQIAYTFLEFLLLEIRGSPVAASQRIRAA
jgi:hypothetical protein